jgi:hypothetical protein
MVIGGERPGISKVGVWWTDQLCVLVDERALSAQQTNVEPQCQSGRERFDYH